MRKPDPKSHSLSGSKCCVRARVQAAKEGGDKAEETKARSQLEQLQIPPHTQRAWALSWRCGAVPLCAFANRQDFLSSSLEAGGSSSRNILSPAAQIPEGAAGAQKRGRSQDPTHRCLKARRSATGPCFQALAGPV